MLVGNPYGCNHMLAIINEKGNSMVYIQCQNLFDEIILYIYIKKYF